MADKPICHVEGCDRKVVYQAAQVCKKHYFRFWKFGSYELVQKPRYELCTVPGCDRKPLSSINKYCTVHYQKFRSRGQIHPHGEFNLRTAIAKVRQELEVTYRGETLLLSEWAQRLGVSASQLARRLQTWTFERAMTQLSGSNGKPITRRRQHEARDTSDLPGPHAER